MYDITNLRGMQNLTKEQLDEMKDKLTRQRWTDFENGQSQYILFLPRNPISSVDALPETDPITNEWQRFYAVPCNFILMLVVALLLLQTYQCFDLMH